MGYADSEEEFQLWDVFADDKTLPEDSTYDESAESFNSVEELLAEVS